MDTLALESVRASGSSSGKTLAVAEKGSSARRNGVWGKSSCIGASVGSAAGRPLQVQLNTQRFRRREKSVQIGAAQIRGSSKNKICPIRSEIQGKGGVETEDKVRWRVNVKALNASAEPLLRQMRSRVRDVPKH